MTIHAKQWVTSRKDLVDQTQKQIAQPPLWSRDLGSAHPRKYRRPNHFQSFPAAPFDGAHSIQIRKVRLPSSSTHLACFQKAGYGYKSTYKLHRGRTGVIEGV